MLLSSPHGAQAVRLGEPRDAQGYLLGRALSWILKVEKNVKCGREEEGTPEGTAAGARALRRDLGKALKGTEGLSRLRRGNPIRGQLRVKAGISPGELKPGAGILEFIMRPGGGEYLEAGIGGREMVGESWPLSDSEDCSGTGTLTHVPCSQLR